MLVLGGSGFIGSWTVRALRACGADVTAVVRSHAAHGRADGAGQPVRVSVLDLADPAAVAPLIDATQPAVVFNLAGYGVDPSERDFTRMKAVNVRLVEAVCAALAATPSPRWPWARLVHVGSALEYGRIEGPLHEVAAVNPTTDYGRTKLQATTCVAASAASGLRAVVARLFTVYGLGEHRHRLLPSLMEVARTGARLELTSGRQRRDFTYVEDVVEGLLRLGVAGPIAGGVVNLATGRLSSVREFAETAADVLGFDRALLQFGERADRDDEMWHDDVPIDQLRAATAWAPSTTIADGISRTWMLSHVA